MRASVVLLLVLQAYYGGCSQLSGILGDAAASQILRHAARIGLSEPRYFEVLLMTTDEPGLGPIAAVDLVNRVGYKNLSLHFHHDQVHVIVDDFSLATQANVTNLLWPLGLDDHAIDIDVQMTRGEIDIMLEESRLALGRCVLSSPSLTAGAPTHWIANAGASIAGYLLSPALDSALCSLISDNLKKLNHTNVMRFPVDELLPEKARRFLASKETNLFYRLNKIHIDSHQMRLLMQIEWNKDIKDDSSSSLLSSSNSSAFDVELIGDDAVTMWLQDGIINELISQVEWDFPWMEETIPLNSPVIPPDSREFLSTLCTECYFLLNVSAGGQPTIQATNSSFVLEKRDSVNLRVVNPDKNVTSVFVAFVLTIKAEIRPAFDNGILRTLVQLLDTNIEMQNGAFPKNWALFMQDLMRGMILDMMWPEIKNAIEELSYGKGVRISKSCGIDPTEMSLDIGEGSFSVTSRLTLDGLDVEKCVAEMKSSLPNPSKLLGGHKRRRRSIFI